MHYDSHHNEHKNERYKSSMSWYSWYQHLNPHKYLVYMWGMQVEGGPWHCWGGSGHQASTLPTSPPLPWQAGTSFFFHCARFSFCYLQKGQVAFHLLSVRSPSHHEANLSSLRRTSIILVAEGPRAYPKEHRAHGWSTPWIGCQSQKRTQFSKIIWPIPVQLSPNRDFHYVKN